MSTTRNDPHSPSNLITESYDYVGSYDSSPTAGMSIEYGPDGAKSVSYGPEAAQRMRMSKLIHESTDSRDDGRCDHCGANIRYRAVLRYRPNGQHIQVGETCLENRFGRATEDFQALRKQAELDRAEQRIKKAVQAFVEANPDLAWMGEKETPEQYKGSFFLVDVARKLRSYGELSERQVAAVRTAMVREGEFQARKRARDAERARQEAERPSAPAPSGRVSVTGEVWKVQEPDEYAQYPTWKMLVADDRGFRVWGSVPRSLASVKRGDRVSFSAEVTPSDKDDKFGFYSRPTQARVVALAPVEGSGK